MATTQQDPQATDRYRTAQAFFSNGEFFRAYDLAREALKTWPAHSVFAHLAVLSLADAGAVALALQQFTELGLDKVQDTEARSLLARLNKDLGFAATGTDRLTLHTQARAIYEQTYAHAATPQDAYYPGINAAALALWCGDREGSIRLAEEVLAILRSLEAEDSDADRYWRKATEAEACLILGRIPEVVRLLQVVRQLAAHQHAQIASTIRQLRRLAQALDLPKDFLVALTLPTVIHYAGHIIARPGQPGRFPADDEPAARTRIESLLAEESVGTGYGSLAAGADILFAEALLARNAALHVILPFAKDDFIAASVASAGETWIARFYACLAAASSVRFATEDRFLHHERLFQYSSQLAMGLAVLAARHMQSPVLQIALWDGVANPGLAGTVADMRVWRKTGRPQRILPSGSRLQQDDLDLLAPQPQPPATSREVHAMLFGDLHGFSKLKEHEIPPFAEQVMGVFGEVVNQFRDRTAFVNTWGDGIFAVFENVCDAAEWALTAQERMKRLDLAAAGLPTDLQLRLGGHLGPVYRLMDPVLQRINFYGAHVSRAARIEPVTPQGCIYVTETFAAVLALNDSDRFACDYAGYTEMAKDYGRLRIFLLRRIRGESGPTVLGDIERPPIPTADEVTAQD